MSNKFSKNNEFAIKVENLSKTFRIPHEKIKTMRGAFVSMFKKKTYEEFQALDNVSFEVKKGEFFGIIGRNGSGKSTLLKILAGIYQPDKGTVKINGMISPFLELGIGFNPELSGRDNVYLNATVLGLTHREIDRKFDSIVKFSELERFIDQKLKNYSSGMQVRLAFSVAIHANRDILLMDEVLAVGDSNFREKCLDVFRNFKKSGKTIFFVSHDAEAVREYCDRALLLHKGKTIVIASPEKAIYEYGRVLMSSEYNLRDQKQKEKEIERKPVGKANYYTKITVLNQKGKEANVFERGEDIVIRLDLEVNKLEDEMYVSVGIRDKITDSVVCGNNMFYEKIDKKWKKGKNRIELVFPNNFLQQGDFYVSSSFFKGNPQNQQTYDYYDGREYNKYIKIIPKSQHQGFVHLPHEWKV